MEKLRAFLRDQALIIAMVVGAGAYLLFHWTPALHPAGPFIHSLLLKMQPALIFLMLLLQFSKVSARDLKFEKWHFKLLAVQLSVCILCAVPLLFAKRDETKVILEAIMLCGICPTATAGGVVTGKIGGSISGIMSYLVLINLMVSILVPAVFPVVHPIEGQHFFESFVSLLGKVFPTLILPAFTAWGLKRVWPAASSFLRRQVDGAFYVWLVSLAISICLGTRSVFNSDIPLWILLAVGVAPVISCFCQFATGRKIGSQYGDVQRITAGQALGQKNTALMIWIGYVFLTPQTSIAGAIYSIFQNIVNSWEITRRYHQKTT